MCCTWSQHLITSSVSCLCFRLNLNCGFLDFCFFGVWRFSKKQNREEENKHLKSQVAHFKAASEQATEQAQQQREVLTLLEALTNTTFREEGGKFVCVAKTLDLEPCMSFHLRVDEGGIVHYDPIKLAPGAPGFFSDSITFSRGQAVIFFREVLKLISAQKWIIKLGSEGEKKKRMNQSKLNWLFKFAFCDVLMTLMPKSAAKKKRKILSPFLVDWWTRLMRDTETESLIFQVWDSGLLSLLFVQFNLCFSELLQRRRFPQFFSHFSFWNRTRCRALLLFLWTDRPTLQFRLRNLRFLELLLRLLRNRRRPLISRPLQMLLRLWKRLRDAPSTEDSAIAATLVQKDVCLWEKRKSFSFFFTQSSFFVSSQGYFCAPCQACCSIFFRSFMQTAFQAFFCLIFISGDEAPFLRSQRPWSWHVQPWNSACNYGAWICNSDVLSSREYDFKLPQCIRAASNCGPTGIGWERSGEPCSRMLLLAL